MIIPLNATKSVFILPPKEFTFNLYLPTMKLLGNASFSEKKIIAGENSAPGVISLITSCEDEKIKENIGLNKDSNVMLIGCEGDTDQKMYQKLISQ